MFPLRDHNHSGSFPLITLLLIALNAIAFFIELSAPNPDAFIYTHALVPSTVNFSDISTLVPFITSMFLHAGWLHILSNMWFLWIFGDNIEATLGKLPYLVFYLFCGIVAGLAQYASMTTSDIPMLGASGAVAGVLGAYLVFFPHARIETLITLGPFISTTLISAQIMLGYWFIIQLFSGAASIVDTAAVGGGVAFLAHAGGFIAGYVLARIVPHRPIYET